MNATTTTKSTTTVMRRTVAGLAIATLAFPVSLAVASAADAATVSSDTATMLQHMVAEEKLAHDVYTVLGDKFDVAIFDNIAAAETRHQASVARVMALYAVADPTVGDAVGSFDDAALQRLYDDLVAQGSASLDAAADAGIAVEKLDIADLDLALATNPAGDITRVLSSLRSGSVKHLSAFESLKADPTSVGTHLANGSGQQNGVGQQAGLSCDDRTANQSAARGQGNRGNGRGYTS